MKTAIVILNWNGEAMLKRFLPSVAENSEDALIVVADNGSTDNSRNLVTNEFPDVVWLQLDKNYGFAEGYNKALQMLDAYCAAASPAVPLPQYYMLLNSDVETPAGWLKKLEDYMDANDDVAACQPKLISDAVRSDFEYAGAAGGFIDRLGYPFCRGRMFNTLECDNGQYDTVTDIFWATGAALMIRREAYWGVGGLDGRFFAHQEEIDLCWRLKARGQRIVCVPQSAVYHVGGGTLPKENPQKTFLNFRNNLLLLYKNLPENQLGSVMRWRRWLDALASFSFLAKGEWKSFCAVWKGRRAYYHMRQDFIKDRSANLSQTICPTPAGFYQGSILADYYLRGKKKWNQLFIVS
ncbi:MAG: glycosyltransferase family 2 protein [Bacteroidaceae bacterium]|nr:glycosyltransferase family 2 protein [Bacteroidaceae bacterium]